MGKSAFKKKPSSYPPRLFHGIRCLQLVSSCVVAGIMFYFIFRSKRENFEVPWMFFFLQGAAMLTLLSLVVSSLFHCCWSLSPIYNGSVNVFIFAIWSVGFGLLAFSMRETITRGCTAALWGSSAGVTVCVCYKALFGFAGFGTLSTFAACVLDYVVCRRQIARGKYIRANTPRIVVKQDTRYLLSDTYQRDADHLIRPDAGWDVTEHYHYERR